MKRHPRDDEPAFFLDEEDVKRLEWLLSWLEADHAPLDAGRRRMLAEQLRALLHVVRESPLLPLKGGQA